MSKILKYPLIVVIIITAISVFFGSQIPKITIDNDAYNFLPHSNPARVAMDRSTEIFGSSDNLSVAIEAKRGTILKEDSIKLIETLTNEFQLIDGVDKVQSLSESDFIYGENGSIIVEPLLNSSDPEDLKGRIGDWDVYENMLISNDNTASQIVVTLDDEGDIDTKIVVYNRLKELTSGYDGYNFHIAGISAINVLLSTNMKGDLALLIPIVVLILLIALFISFKRLSGVILPILTVIVSTTWTIGLMGLLGVPLSMLGVIIPVLMMAVGSAYGIHVISHYYDDIREFKGELTTDAHNSIIIKSLKYVRKPIFLAGLTTVAGFGSLSISEIIPMRNFGIFTAAGIVFALIVALTLIPSLLIFNYRSARKKKSLKSQESRKIEDALGFFYTSFGKRKYLILFLTSLVLIFSAIGTSRMVVDNSLIEFFKEDTHIRISDTFLREKFSGTNYFEINISGDGAGTDAQLLKEMDILGNHLVENYDEITKVLSFTDSVKRINQVMHIEGEESFDDFDDESYDDYTEDSESFDSGSFFFDDEEDSTDPVLFDDVESYEPKEEAIEILLKAYSKMDSRDSLPKLIDQVKKDSNYLGYDYYEIPYDLEKYNHSDYSGLSDLLSQYYSLTGKLDGFIGETDDFLEPQNLKMTVMINTTGNIFIRELLPELEEYIKDYFPKGYDIRIAGQALAMDATTTLVTSSAINSVLLSLVIVFIILSISYKSIFAGILGIIPLGTTVLFNYGVMGFFGIKLDMSTAMVGSIAIGIGIDYTIHFLSSYTKFSKVEDNRDVVTKKALVSSGKAIVFNALSVAAGFLVLIKSNFNPLMYLGVLITITMLVSSISSLTIMPALLNIFKPKFTNRRDK